MDDLSPDHLQSVLKQIDQGSAKGIEVLYRHYHAALFAFIRHRVSVDEAAEEIVNDTFMAIYHKPLAYNGDCKFFTWLCSIAKNKTVDWLRSNGRQQNNDKKVEYLNATLEDSACLSWSVTEHYEKGELQKVMQGCLDKLPDTQREAAYWAYYHDLRLKEVALIAECTENTIKTRLSYARLKIRDCLERAYDGLEIGNNL